MVVSRKQMNPSTTRKTGQAGGSRKQMNPSTTRKAGHVGGSRKTKSREEGNVMRKKCMRCALEGRKGEVEIRDVKEIAFKGKGDKMRKRLAGVCEHGHKWSQMIKSD